MKATQLGIQWRRRPHGLAAATPVPEQSGDSFELIPRLLAGVATVWRSW